MIDFRIIEDELERAFEAAGFEVLHASGEAYLVSIPHTGVKIRGGETGAMQGQIAGAASSVIGATLIGA